MDVELVEVPGSLPPRPQPLMNILHTCVLALLSVVLLWFVDVVAAHRMMVPGVRVECGWCLVGLRAESERSETTVAMP